MTPSIRRLLIVFAVMTFALLTLLVTGATNFPNWGDDPDLPPYAVTDGEFSKEDFMTRRAEGIALKRGISKDTPFDPQARPAALRQMELQEERVTRMPQSHVRDSLLAPWVALGPAPIPNGQTIGVQTPVSGRTISIAVHPTNPDIVYVGAAQGGLYRSTDGGTNWTALMDNALSLAIGAIAIAPSQPDTIYVGTGEVGFCGDCFFGVGVYRIDNASTAAPVISGPFNDEVTTDNDVFTGRGIGEIVVHPTLPGTIFVASGSGIGGIGGVANNVLPARGLFRSTDATSADPSFTKMVMTGPAAQDRAIVDIAIDPGNPDLVVCTLADTFALNEGGVFRSTDALAPAPTFTRTFIAGSGTSASRTELALHRDGVSGVVTVYAGSGLGNGTVQRSTDGGATWAQRVDNNFCNPQCFYDIGIAVDPTNVNNVYVGGSPQLAFGRSTDGGATFTNNAATAQGLHVDSHAIEVAPSQPSTIYFGSDGGIYKSTNSGTNWTPLNNTQYSATQFMSLALHPTDRYFTIGGTQDNGTNFFQPTQLWTNTEGGDGGYTQIDQNAPNNTAVTMYHTFFNQTNAMGYSRSLNAGNTWSFFGCGFAGTPNGMDCVGVTAILFYAPMERGPGNPNTLYFGSDVLYRSSDSGVSVAKVSQEPIGGAVSAIGIAPQNDAVRIIGTSTGGIFGTSTGANPLLNLDALGAIPNNFVGRAVVDPNSATTAYVTLVAFGVTNVWKTTDLNAVNPTWTAAVGGLPQVPVSAFVIDPQDSNALYAGTDIGVYQSLDGGANWLPFGTGLPRVAVFGAQISNVHRILRIATHGRGIFEIGIPGVGIPVPRPAGDGTSGPGGASSIVFETCANGAIDPNETARVSYAIQNVGGGPTTNLVATLQATGGVTLPGAPQSYGAIAAGATLSREFNFTASGNCGDTITLTFQLQDGATDFGTFTVDYTLGELVTSAPAFTENFDAVVAPALPAGWTTAQAGAAPLWATTTSFSDTAPNSAATTGVATPGDNSLTSPTIAIPPAPGMGSNPTVQLSFRNNFNTEGGFDGGVLEISINGGAFADIVTAGGSFAAGGYNGVLGPTDHALSGRQGWTGNSNGFITTLVNLPPASFSQNAQLRWRSAYDTGTTSSGIRVDTISIYAVSRICCSVPTAAPATISGRITTSDGSPLAGVTMNLSGARSARVITDSNGNYRFRNIDTDNFYTVTPSLVNYHFGPESRSFSLLANITDAVFTATRDTVISGNAIDTAEFFVRQHYVDFLGREPDESGFNFWSDQILGCGSDAACIERRTINVSAAYFLSIEFQQTGGLVDGFYRASYGRRPLYAEFLPDTQTVARDVIVGHGDWARQLELNKQAFVEAWVQRADFRAAYDGLTNAGYVDRLIGNTRVSFSAVERDALVSGLNSGTMTRSAVLRQIAEDERFVSAKRNEMFVMMEYFGYLRRDPDASGFQFWLNKLNQFGGNFEQAEMVKAFIVSGEYRGRFRL